MWSDSDKDRFYDQLKQAVMTGATPEEIIKEVEQGYYMALDDMKKAAKYSFDIIFKRNRF